MIQNGQKIGGREISHPLNFVHNTTDRCDSQNYTYIPIDYIKCEVIGLDKTHFLNNTHLEFTPKLKSADEIHFYYLIDQNIKIKIYESNRIFLDGSLHKYANNGIHNHDQFTQLEFNRILEKLNSRFGIKPHNLRIICLEFGYNITPPIDCDWLIDHLLRHQQKDVEILLSNDRAKYRQFKHRNYIIKVYNKGKQYKCDDPILRIEIKQTNWSEFRSIGINTLQQFIERDKTIYLDKILTKWNEILIYDPTIKGNSKFMHYRDVNYWKTLREKFSVKTYNKHVQRLKEINATKGENVQKQISDLIQEKADSMEGGNVLQLSGKKYCKLTGVEIKNQRETSFLLSHGGLKYILYNHPDQYRNIERRFLSGKWKTADNQTKIKEIAHNIRTHYTRKKQRISTNQFSLWGNELQVYV